MAHLTKQLLLSIPCTSHNTAQNNLHGPIPQELGSLQLYGELNLADNNLSGTVPQELAQLTQATQIYLNGNALEGSLEFMCEALEPTFQTSVLSELRADREEVECSCCLHRDDDGDV